MSTLLFATSDDITAPKQAYSRTSTWRMADGSKVRTVIHIDGGHTVQSVIKSEMWDGTKWNVVVTVNPCDPTLELASSYLPRDRAAEKETTLITLEAELLRRTSAVLA